METTKKLIFDRNTMATTVGANSLNVEIIVSQPSNTQDELMVDGLDYVFNQAKFEEHLSSSSSRSSSPKRRRILSPRKTQREDFLPIVVNASPCNIIPASPKVEGPAHQSATTLTKRARQRQRQKLARQLAKAMESTDGVRYRTNSRDQRRQQITAPQSQTVSTPADEEWVLVKRTRSTKKERAQRRCAHAAQAREIIRKAQEAKGSNRKVWIPKSGPNLPRKLAASRGREKGRADRAAAQTAALTARQSQLPRPPRGGPNCRANATCTRDNSNCLGKIEAILDTFNGPDQSSPFRLLTSPADVSPAKPEKSASVFNRLGPLLKNQGKASVHERLGHARQHTGGRAQNLVTVPKHLKQAGTSQDSRIPVASRLSIPQGVRETVVGNNSKRVVIREVTRDDNTIMIHAKNNSSEKRPKVSSQHSQRKTCYQKNVTLGGCTCPESDAHSHRTSAFGRLSLPATEESKPKSRRFRRRRRFGIHKEEFPEVTINMVGKGKGPATDSDPDFTPGGKVSSQISQRMSRLQLRATQRIDYRRMHEGESSEDEISDACSAIASDDTTSSVGQAREAFTITPETLAQMLQEALAKQKEDLKAEMRTEMELAMQQMRELQTQTVAQPEFSQQGGPSHHVAHDIEDSDTEVDENIIADRPPKNTQSEDDTTHLIGGDNFKQSEGEGGRMKELESKINALISAQEIKKTGIPCPYPREWDSIPYPAKFNLINFTPFDGKGSPMQHLIYFKSHLGVISGNEPLMVRSFVGTLRGAAFNWYRRLKTGSINCWNDMESSFLSNFFDDDTEVSIGTLLDEKQKSGEPIDAFVKRFRNKAVNCKDPITEEFILQTCHNNLSTDLLEVMRVVPPTSWKDLKIRGEQAERFLRRKKTERGKTTEVNFDSHNKDGTYSFTDEEVPIIFKHLLDSNKIKLPPITNQEEADKTSDPKYCAYHRRILHPTKDCIVLKATIQALVEAGVLTPK